MKLFTRDVKIKVLCLMMTFICVFFCLFSCGGVENGKVSVSFAASDEVPDMPDSAGADSLSPKSSEIEASEAELSEALSAPESSDKELSATEVSEVLSKSDSPVLESSEAETSKIEDSAAEISKAEGSQTESSAAEISEAESSEAESSEAELSREPEDTQNRFVPPVPLPARMVYDEADLYFNGSLFVGYSIMMHFGRYVAKWRENVHPDIMGNAVFCCAVGETFRANAVQTPQTPNNTLPKYRGESYNFEDLPVAVGCGTLYVGLTGYADLSGVGTLETSAEQTANATVREIEKILKKNPRLSVVILPTTYNTGKNATGALTDPRLSNENIRKYNNYILSYCNSRGLDFVDVATPMTDGRGLFRVRYASDRDYHIKEQAYYIWVNVLRDYSERKQAGTWKNYDTMPPLVVEKAN